MVVLLLEFGRGRGNIFYAGMEEVITFGSIW